VRYVSDSSYWLYLVHLPLIIVGQVLVRGLELPAMVKFTVLVAGATVILLVSYQLLVRYTWIGRLLNGPRTRRQSHGSIDQKGAPPDQMALPVREGRR
jgi:peptidoglycan/LPS O-acetylase OafA/YrhL